MADDRTQRGPQDSSRINLNEDYEVRYWTNKFNCTEAELRRAVQASGSIAAKVEQFLKGNAPSGSN
jgi:hypothetical protein